MKNKIVTVILGIALLISLAGNIYLFNNNIKNKDAVNDLSDQLVTTEGQIKDLQEKLNDLEKLQNQVSDLQGQLADSDVEIESLETALAESNIIIAELESQKEKDAGQSGQSSQPTEKPQVEKQDFDVSEEFWAGFRTDISDIPVWDVDVSSLGEDCGVDSRGYIGH